MPSSPRSVAWLLLLVSAAAVLLTGIASTLGAVRVFDLSVAAAPTTLWGRVALAAALTLASVGLRALRWIFLLRRSGTRIPIRDAYIGYLAGFSLLVAPLLVGEIAVRAYVLRARNGVSPTRTLQVNIWERVCDVIALVVLVTLQRPAWFAAAMVVVVIGLFVNATRTGAIATLASIAAWVFPALGLWSIAGEFGDIPASAAVASFATSTLTLAPAGVLSTGFELTEQLQSMGIVAVNAVAIVILTRVATVGLSTTLGLVVLTMHFLTAGKTAEHFDDLADAYDAQIPVDRRNALLARKTEMMRDVLGADSRRGLDVGCGQGWYVARMRTLGFDVEGIDASAGQLQNAARYVGSPAFVRLGSALAIPAPNHTYDFVYTINVLHHLASVDDQRRAFNELSRVLKPGGILFVHEINTRNPLFRFYMGYVFPTLNCIDEGVERWLLPHRLGGYTDLPVREIRYFTFLPEFLPQAIVRLLSPLERWLERSTAAPFSAHYMAVLKKPA